MWPVAIPSFPPLWRRLLQRPAMQSPKRSPLRARVGLAVHGIRPLSQKAVEVPMRGRRLGKGRETRWKSYRRRCTGRPERPRRDGCYPGSAMPHQRWERPTQSRIPQDSRTTVASLRLPRSGSLRSDREARKRLHRWSLFR